MFYIQFYRLKKYQKPFYDSKGSIEILQVFTTRRGVLRFHSLPTPHPNTYLPPLTPTPTYPPSPPNPPSTYPPTYPTPSLHLAAPTYPSTAHLPNLSTHSPHLAPPALIKMSAFLKHFNMVCWATFVFFPVFYRLCYCTFIKLNVLAS